jgi:lysophospholipase L1-like esterase
MAETAEKKAHLFLFQVLTPILIILFLALLAEIGLRFAGFNPLKSLHRGDGTHAYYLRQSDDPALRYEPNPGFRGKLFQAGIGMRINALGMRGREIEPAKDGKFRIAMLGDSITFAKDFEERDIFPVRLENRLRETIPSVEVLNLGAEGYDTLEEAVHFRRIGLALKPDIVVVNYCLNDIGITPLDFGYLNFYLRPRLPVWTKSRLAVWIASKVRRIQLQQRLQKKLLDLDGFAERTQSRYPEIPTDEFLESQFRLIDESQRAFDAAGQDDHKRAVAEKSGSLWLNQYKSLHNLGKIRYAFGELKAMAEAGGFKVLVAIIPFFYRVGGRYIDGPAHAIVRREAERAGFKAVDLYDTFAAEGLEEMTFDSVHMNPKGHAVMSRALAEALREWLPAAPPIQR